MTLPFHPLADLFPLIEGAEFDELVASIRANGLRDPIIVHDGAVIDGRNRQRACEAAEVPCIYHPLPSDGDPLAYVLDKNLRRRHLNESQRAYVAAKLANLNEGRPPETAQICAVSQNEAAEKLNVSRRSVQHAAVVRDRAAPEIQRAVERGQIAISAAAQAAKFTPETQRKIAEGAEAGKENVVRTVIKQETRAAREIELGAKQSALPTRKYGLILADPEWRFEPYSRDSGMDRAPDNHYSTSATEEIATRDIGSIAADDSVLLLWAIAPMLPDALSVMSSWGFKYKSHLIWDKMIPGTGYWFIGRHELLLVGTRGHMVAPAMGTQLPSIVQSAKGRHSAKPELILEWIDRTFPSLPKIELNRRGPARPGWDAWGNEAVIESPATGASPGRTEPASVSTPTGAGSSSHLERESEVMPNVEPGSECRSPGSNKTMPASNAGAGNSHPAGELTDDAPRMGIVEPAPRHDPAAASSSSDAVKGAGDPSVDPYEIPDLLLRKSA